jgi:hypothetical protein
MQMRCQQVRKRMEVGDGGREGRGGSRRRRNESGSASSRRKAADTKACLAQREMELEGGGRRVQPCCAGVRLAEEREGSLAKVCSVLLEVRAGLSPWNGLGEVLVPQLQGAAQDHPLVLASERIREVDELMDFVANDLTLARKEVAYELDCADGCACSR